MTETICDHCGRIIKRNLWTVRATSANYYIHRFDLCEECVADLKRFMNVEEKQPACCDVSGRES